MTERRLQNTDDEDLKKSGRTGFPFRGFVWFLLLLASVLLNAAARLADGFAEWYAVTVYPLIVGSVGRSFSIFPFSAAEFILYLLCLALAAGVAGVFLRKWRITGFLSAAAKTAIVLLLVYMLGCGINYHRTAFSEKAGFVTDEYTAQELKALCVFLAEEFNAYAEEIEVDQDGYFALDVDVASEAVAAMQALGETYEDLAGYYPKAKGVLVWQLLSYQQLEGIYSPFTIEANFNSAAPQADQPASVCHELSHLKGFMREDEANFIAYLACMESESAAFRYSGTMTAYIYSINALYDDDAAAAAEVRGLLCEQAQKDLSYHNDYWNAYEGTVSETADKVNDTYLKANAQADGTKSYGRMVDLLLAWYETKEG